MIQKRRISWDNVFVDTSPSLYCFDTCSNSIAILLIVIYFSVYFLIKNAQPTSAWLLAYAALSVNAI